VIWHRSGSEKPEWRNFVTWLFQTQYKPAINDTEKGYKPSYLLNINDSGDPLISQLAEAVTIEKLGFTYQVRLIFICLI